MYRSWLVNVNCSVLKSVRLKLIGFSDDKYINLVTVYLSQFIGTITEIRPSLFMNDSGLSLAKTQI